MVFSFTFIVDFSLGVGVLEWLCYQLHGRWTVVLVNVDVLLVLGTWHAHKAEAGSDLVVSLLL